MSYDHNVFVGHFAKCKLKNGSGGRLHWLLEETDDATIREMTKGRAGLEDTKPLKDAHYIFPEFMHDKDKYAYIMLPGYTELSDVSRGDCEVEPVSQKMEFDLHEVSAAMMKAFDFEEVAIDFGVIVEVR